jgi:cytochrome c-type biogenesis protein
MSILVAYGLAFWLGILTSISPCPLATNIAAVTFIGKKVGGRREVLCAGFWYSVGRSAVYLVLAVVLSLGVLSIPGVSEFLQIHFNKIVGPVLVVAGMFLLDLLAMPGGKGVDTEKAAGILDRYPAAGALLLGILFALSFCPVSAALFFGSLVPLSVSHSSPVVIPVLYGIGTAFPVVLFALLIAFGTGYVGTAFRRISVFEKWSRRITGVVFVVVGIWFSLTYIFGINIY